MEHTNNWNNLYNKILALYDVTIDGRIINKKTNQTLKRGRLRKGYERKNFYIDEGKSVTIFIHRLVAYKFHHNPNPKKLSTVDHINNIRDDNKASNLKWMSFDDNVRKPSNGKRRH